MIEELNYIREGYEVSPVPPINLKFWEWWCPKPAPKGEVHCVGRISAIRCPGVIHCPGLPEGHQPIALVVRKLGERAISQLLDKGIITEDEAKALTKDVEAVYEKHVKTAEEFDTTTKILNFLKSPMGIALIGGLGLLIIIFLMKK
jgi:hypothetical protein